MNASAPFVNAAIGAGIALLSMLALSLVFPGLGNPLALALGAAAGVAVTSRDRLRLDTPAPRLTVVVFALSMGVVLWLYLQPGYVGA